MGRSSFALLPLTLLASVASAANHVVTVGKGGQLKFDPQTLTANPGDTVTYEFFAKNHSVTQSSFDDPCHPLEGGFFSGFTPNPSSDEASATTWTITVNDTKPIWVYCGQTTGNHCQNGMVHAINAPATGNTFDAYKSKAAQASLSTSPPGGRPVGGLRLLKVEVGAEGKLAFSPNNITEIPGTVVQFSFNPKNHSVVQSSFADPCHPLAGGFSSGFVPTDASPSGVVFDIVIEDTRPIWFYCAQTAKNHCQSGMVGSINAMSRGNTLQDYIHKASYANTSTIPPQAPLGGVLSVNGTVIPSLGGNVLNISAIGLDPGSVGNVPPPGTNVSSYIWGMAGGGQPSSYNWAPSISDAGTNLLRLLQFLDNLLLEVLFAGHGNIVQGGSWSGIYPQTIVETIGTVSAQALVHRSTATDSLQHYDKPLVDTCSPSSVAGLRNATGTVDDFLDSALALLLLEIGVLVDGVTNVAARDPWLVPALAAALGAKTRAAAVVNLMQGHAAAATPREAALPPALAWSYAARRWAWDGSSAADCAKNVADGMPSDPYPALRIVSTQKVASVNRVESVTVQWDDKSSQKSDNLFLAWVGPWGALEFSPVAKDGSSSVPSQLYGHGWVVLTNKNEGKLSDLPSITVAGPEMLWIGQP